VERMEVCRRPDETQDGSPVVYPKNLVAFDF
jgi:hypothetical protein